MKSYSRSKEMFQLEQKSNGAQERWTKGAMAYVVKMLDSQSSSKPLGQFNLLPFQGRLSEYQEVLGTKNKLSPHSGSVVLRQVNPIHKKGLYSFFLIFHKYNNTRCNLTP